MLHELAQILYRYDPAGLGSYEHQHEDEYQLEAQLLYENYQADLIKNYVELKIVLTAILKYCFFEDMDFDLSQEMLHELAQVFLLPPHLN